MKTLYHGPKDRSRWHGIGVYDSLFEVVLCHDIDKARHTKKRVKLLGDTDDCKGCAGMCDYYKNKFIVFFDRGWLSPALIAHEVFHATHRMLEWAGVGLGKQHAEAHAHLCGHLTQLVYDDLKSWKVRIK